MINKGEKSQLSEKERNQEKDIYIYIYMINKFNKN